MDQNTRHCRYCGRALAQTMNKGAIYCDSTCRSTAWKHRWIARTGYEPALPEGLPDTRENRQLVASAWLAHQRVEVLRNMLQERFAAAEDAYEADLNPPDSFGPGEPEFEAFWERAMLDPEWDPRGGA